MLLLMVGVISSAMGRNEWQQDDMEKVTEPSPSSQAVGKLNVNIEIPVKDYEVDESAEEIALQVIDDHMLSESAKLRNVSPVKENVSSTEVSEKLCVCVVFSHTEVTRSQ